MRVVTRMIFKRAETPGDEAVPVSAEYADAPDALGYGLLAQCALDEAVRRGDDEGARIIRGTMDAAWEDGVIMTM